MLSSVNIFRVGEKGGLDEEYDEDDVLEEGAEDEEGEGLREKAGLPDVGGKRMKHFLQEGKRKEWEFEEGRVYSCDFFNPYLDFNREFQRISFSWACWLTERYRIRTQTSPRSFT